MTRWLTAILVAGVVSVPTTSAPQVVSPPMGWSTWATYGCQVNENHVRFSADALAFSGMRDAGYTHVIVDDCWMSPDRSPDGDLQGDPSKFPGGMKALGDYLHGKGLKFGLYASAASSLAHETQDARQFAAWGVDYVKYDWDSPDGALETQIQRFTLMRDALAATGRPIVYGINPLSRDHDWSGIAHTWRTTVSGSAQWADVADAIDVNGALADRAGPSHWNDPGVLHIGVPGLTAEESRAQFGMWAMMAAPLIASNDVRNLPLHVKTLLTNAEAIAVDADALGIQGREIREGVWRKPLADGSVAILLLNRAPTATTVSVTAAEAGLSTADAYLARDLWTHRDTVTAGRIAAHVPPHGAAFYRVRPATSKDRVQAAPMFAVDIAIARQLEIGQPAELTATFTNLGVRGVRSPSIALSTPDDWAVSAVSGTSVGGIAAGATHTARWRLTPVQGLNKATTAVSISIDPVVTSAKAVVYTVTAPAGPAYLGDLPFLSSVNGWGPVERNTSNGEAGADDGRPMILGGVTYAKGLGVHAYSSVLFYVDGRCNAFSAVVGVDDEVGDQGSVAFEVWAEGRRLAASGALRGTDPGRTLAADVTGAIELELRVTDLGDTNAYDHADWADARITCHS